MFFESVVGQTNLLCGCDDEPAVLPNELILLVVYETQYPGEISIMRFALRSLVRDCLIIIVMT